MPFRKAASLQLCIDATRPDETVLVLDIDIYPTERAMNAIENALGGAATVVYVAGANFYGPGILATRSANIVRAGGFMPAVFTHHGCEDTSLAARLSATGAVSQKVYTDLVHEKHARNTSFYGRKPVQVTCHPEKVAWPATTADAHLPLPTASP